MLPDELEKIRSKPSVKHVRVLIREVEKMHVERFHIKEELQQAVSILYHTAVLGDTFAAHSALLIMNRLVGKLDISGGADGGEKGD